MRPVFVPPSLSTSWTSSLLLLSPRRTSSETRKTSPRTSGRWSTSPAPIRSASRWTTPSRLARGHWYLETCSRSRRREFGSDVGLVAIVGADDYDYDLCLSYLVGCGGGISGTAFVAPQVLVDVDHCESSPHICRAAGRSRCVLLTGLRRLTYIAMDVMKVRAHCPTALLYSSCEG